MNKDTRIDIKGVKIYPFTDPDALVEFAQQRKGLLIAINAEKILYANDNTKRIIADHIGYCDGEWAAMAVRQKGGKATKIAGCELWLHIIRRHQHNRSFYIIGATPEVHRATIEKLRREFPNIRIVGHRDGYIKTEQERQALIEDVVRTAPDFVFVAMGSPKQEVLMEQLNSRHPAVYQGLGGSFNVYTGAVKRAPRWWREHRLEAAYRLITQPQRITRNYRYVQFMWWLATRQV